MGLTNALSARWAIFWIPMLLASPVLYKIVYNVLMLKRARNVPLELSCLPKQIRASLAWVAVINARLLKFAKLVQMGTLHTKTDAISVTLNVLSASILQADALPALMVSITLLPMEHAFLVLPSALHAKAQQSANLVPQATIWMELCAKLAVHPIATAAVLQEFWINVLCVTLDII